MPTEAESQEEEQVTIDDTEDVQEIKTAKDPRQPSAEEVEEHRCTHLPFRDWCKWCIMGRGRGLQHSRTLASWIPIVGLDYFYITKGGVMKREELEQEIPRNPEGESDLNALRLRGDIVKCIIMRCLQTRIIFAHVIPYKGAHEDKYVAQLVAEDIAWIGHTRLILKSDNEPALQTLITQSLERARVRCEGVDQIAQEHPAKYDSQSNGGVEVGIQILRGQFRTVRLCFEARIEKSIPIDHAVIPWLLEHTCLILNARQKGTDGLSAWARVRGRPFNQRLLGFGEKVLYKYPMKGPHSQPEGNMGAKWGDGVFIGYHRSSNSYIVSHAKGVSHPRSLARRPPLERWSAADIAEIMATPWSLHERPEREVRFHDPAQQPEEPPDVRPAPAL